MTGEDFRDRHDRRPLAERAVVVIGTGNGALAPAIARQASARGARVALATNDALVADPLDTASRFTSALESEAAIDRLFDVVLERRPKVDIVIVVLEVPALHALHTLSLARWREGIAGPLRQAFWIAQRALDEFMGSDGGGGLIFVIARAEGDTAGDGVGIVAEAAASLARSLAREYGRRRVSCQVVVQGGLGAAPSSSAPHDALVECVLFLASSNASFVTGEVIVVERPAALPPTAPGAR